MPHTAFVLIHPPVAKPSEPPAGIARLAGALRSHGVPCAVIDANIEGLYNLLQKQPDPADTWTHRAWRHLDRHLIALRSIRTYSQPDVYRRAVSDINRLVSLAGREHDVQIGLANYGDKHLVPARSADLLQAAAQPQRNLYYPYFRDRVLPAVSQTGATAAGITITYLSQALCAFALIGMLRKEFPALKIIIGGGLVTSWLKQPHWTDRFSDLVDQMVAGPGEAALLDMAGGRPETGFYQPEYDDLFKNEYLSPGRVVPFSASDGCWWRRCAFCPERSERRPFRPLPHRKAVEQLRHLSRKTRPAIIHLLDNALSPALLKTLSSSPPGAPWYGFVRIGPPLDDPDFCHQLAASGCVMLKLGLESGDQQVLDTLDKGIRLDMATAVLCNLKQAGIATYVYLLFGTPAEDEEAAYRTLTYTAEYSELIDFLNLAIFNLPLGGPQAPGLRLRPFYPADLALYSDFEHPRVWDRSAVRRFIEKRFKKHPAIQPIIRRDPLIFTSNHAAFFSPTLHTKKY